jgi:integrase
VAAKKEGSAQQHRSGRPPATRQHTRGRPKTGTVTTWTRKNGDIGFAVKFFDQHGIRRYERCGLASEGWSRRRAELELENFENEVAARTYVPTPDVVPTAERDPCFGPFARAYLAEHAVEIRPNTRDFYDGLLENHLAPFFEQTRLSQIGWSEVDGYKKQRLRLMQRLRAAKANGKPLRADDNRPLSLSERTINHSLNLLSQILDEAVRRPNMDLSGNPARDRKHRVKVPKTRPRDWLEPDEVMTLLEAAEQIDNPVRPETERKARTVRRLRDVEKLTIKQIAEQLAMSEGGVCWLYDRRPEPVTSPRRAAIATLSASGTRNTELCRLRWHDLDFQHDKILIRAAKTNQGVREIDITPWLRKELLAYKQGLGAVQPNGLVFPTRTGTMRDKDNLNRRVVQPVQRAAANLRAERGLPALPAQLSAHVFRRTYATLMIEAGASPRYVQHQLGHGSAKLTLEVYTRVSDSRDRSSLGRAFDELVAGVQRDETPLTDRRREATPNSVGTAPGQGQPKQHRTSATATPTAKVKVAILAPDHQRRAAGR